jgi:hypothetical protein
MTFTSGEYNYTLQEFVENVTESMGDEGCNATCVDSILTADAASFEAVATECGCPTYMLRYNNAQTLNLEGEEAGEEATAPEAADEEAAETEEAGEGAAETEDETAGGSKTPYVIGGGVGLVAIIGGIFFYKKS